MSHGMQTGAIASSDNSKMLGYVFQHISTEVIHV